MNQIAHTEGLTMGRKKFYKRGRPKSVRPKIDQGTPELQARRAAAMAGAGKDVDPTLAEHPLGIMLARGFLHPNSDQAKRMYDAGVSFASLWIAANPKVFPTGTLGRLQPGSHEEVDEDAADRLKAACAHLAKERNVYDAVVNTCVYGRVNLRNMEKLRTGLCRLAEWGRDQARVQRMAAE